MLDEGTATRNALQIADEVAQLGATLGTNSSMDFSTVTGRSLRKNLAGVLELMADVALHPSFPEEEVGRQRSSRLAQLVQQRDTYVRACRKAGRDDTEIAGLLSRWGVSRHIYVAATDAQARAEAREAEMWYQEALRRFLVPDDIDRVHPLLQPGFRAAAERLHIHPNTLRYRVRRATAVSGIDLNDPGERLFTQLQLLMEQH